MTELPLKKAFESLPEQASEPIVSNNLIYKLLEKLGFTNLEVYPEFPTGDGTKVDFAARNNTNNDVFLESAQNPFLILEVKGRERLFLK